MEPHDQTRSEYILGDYIKQNEIAYKKKGVMKNQTQVIW